MQFRFPSTLGLSLRQLAADRPRPHDMLPILVAIYVTDQCKGTCH